MSKVLLCFVAWLSHATNAFLQNGINQNYLFDHGDMTFREMKVKNDKIYCLGISLPLPLPAYQTLTVAKIDSSGNLINYTTLQDTAGGHLSLTSNSGFTVCQDGGVAFLAHRIANKWLYFYKLDKSLSVEYLTKVELPGERLQCYSLIETEEGFLAVGQTTADFKLYSGLLMRLDKSGDLIEAKRYSVSNYLLNYFNEVIPYTDSTFLLFGLILDNSYPVKEIGRWFVEVDKFGEVVNEHISLSASIDQYVPWAVEMLPDKSLFVCAVKGYGFLNPNGTSPYGQFHVGKMSKNFEYLWNKPVGPVSTFDFIGIQDIALTPDGGFVFAGERAGYGYSPTSTPPERPGGWLFKCSAEGDSLWSRLDYSIGADPLDVDFNTFKNVEVLSSGSIVAAGYSGTDHFEGWLIKVSLDGCIDTLLCNTSKILDSTKTAGLEIFPNPATTVLRVKWQEPFAVKNLQIFDVGGREMPSPNVKLDIDGADIWVSGFASGIYFIKLTDEQGKSKFYKFMVQ